MVIPEYCEKFLTGITLFLIFPVFLFSYMTTIDGGSNFNPHRFATVDIFNSPSGQKQRINIR